MAWLDKQEPIWMTLCVNPLVNRYGENGLGVTRSTFDPTLVYKRGRGRFHIDPTPLLPSPSYHAHRMMRPPPPNIVQSSRKNIRPMRVQKAAGDHEAGNSNSVQQTYHMVLKSGISMHNNI